MDYLNGRRINPFASNDRAETGVTFPWKSFDAKICRCFECHRQITNGVCRGPPSKPTGHERCTGGHKVSQISGGRNAAGTYRDRSYWSKYPIKGGPVSYLD